MRGTTGAGTSLGGIGDETKSALRSVMVFLFFVRTVLVCASQ